MNGRTQILDAIRKHDLPQVQQPSLDGPWTHFDDPRQQFAQVLESVGGQCIVVPSTEAIAGELATRPEYTSARKVYSAIDGLVDSPVGLAALDDPHVMESIEYAILPGEFCVAENGAVWVTDKPLKHRVLYFIVQHLALIVPEANIVSNMHQAYEKLSFTEPHFGGFISGPSKTADIEQSLVIGAHGPRSLTVFLLASGVSGEAGEGRAGHEA